LRRPAQPRKRWRIFQSRDRRQRTNKGRLIQQSGLLLIWEMPASTIQWEVAAEMSMSAGIIEKTEPTFLPTRGHRREPAEAIDNERAPILRHCRLFIHDDLRLAGDEGQMAASVKVEPADLPCGRLTDAGHRVITVGGLRQRPCAVQLAQALGEEIHSARAEQRAGSSAVDDFPDALCRFFNAVLGVGKIFAGVLMVLLLFGFWHGREL
jgi:hypothetical protein